MLLGYAKRQARHPINPILQRIQNITLLEILPLGLSGAVIFGLFEHDYARYRSNKAMKCAAICAQNKKPATKVFENTMYGDDD